VDIRGLEKTTLLDYPGKVACTVFVSGCNFRCPFCYNHDLVLNPEKLPQLTEESFFQFLDSRRGILDGVVVCGGEPTLQKDLGQFVRRIKDRGFLVKLDTNGSTPEVIKKLLEEGLLDFVSLDIKAPLEDEAYAAATGLADFEERIGLEKILSSIRVLAGSGIEFELRTTVVPGLHGKSSLIKIAKQLRNIFTELFGSSSRAAPPWYLQQFEPKNCLDPSFTKKKPFRESELKAISLTIRKIFPSVRLR